MVRKKTICHHNSIQEYLNLFNQNWYIELEINDFGIAIAKILDLPTEVFTNNPKNHFWAFLSKFLQTSEIGFILRTTSRLEKDKVIDLALLGVWDDKQFAIPLWILEDLMLGFEIISADNYITLDSMPLDWSPCQLLPENTSDELKKQQNYTIIADDIFQGQKIYLMIDKNKIVVSKYSNELELFERISKTIIPELDNEDEEL